MNTATAPPATLTQHPRQSFGAKRVLLLVFGGLALLLALGLLIGGGAAVWGLSQRDDSGFFTSGAHALSTDTYALASESLDIGPDPTGILGDFATVRIQASSSEPVFIGIGPLTDVERYLSGVAYDQITDFEVDPFTVDYSRVEGREQPAPPASQGFWRVQASGSGTQTISWPMEQGEWAAVAMNADGSRAVSIDAGFGARVPALRWFAIGLLAAGGLMLLAGAGLIYWGARRPRSPRPGVE
jgi:hypothetical protein